MWDVGGDVCRESVLSALGFRGVVARPFLDPRSPLDPSALRGACASDDRTHSECCGPMLRSGENSRSDLMRRAVDADGIIEPTRVDNALSSDVVSAQSSDGCRRISSSEGVGDAVVATAESLTVGGGV